MTQDEYIAILFNDCGFNGPGRRDWLQREYGSKYSDGLTTRQRSEIIERLKVIKEHGKPVPNDEDEEDGMRGLC